MSRDAYTGADVNSVKPVPFLDQYALLHKRSHDRLRWTLTNVTGTNDLTVTLAPDFDAGGIQAGMRFSFVAAAESTGPVTLAINGGAAIDVLDARGLALPAGTLLPTMLVHVEYDGTDFRMTSATGIDRRSPFQILAPGDSIRSRIDAVDTTTSSTFATRHSFAFVQFGEVRVSAEHRAQGHSGGTGASQLRIVRRRNGDDTVLETWTVNSPTGAGNYSAWTKRALDVLIEPGDVVRVEHRRSAGTSSMEIREARFSVASGINLWPGSEARLEGNAYIA